MKTDKYVSSSRVGWPVLAYCLAMRPANARNRSGLKAEATSTMENAVTLGRCRFDMPDVTVTLFSSDVPASRCGVEVQWCSGVWKRQRVAWWRVTTVQAHAHTNNPPPSTAYE